MKKLVLLPVLAIAWLLLLGGCPGEESDNGPAQSFNEHSGDVQDAAEQTASGKGERNIYNWVWELREKAFKVLIPQGWSVDGGIYRLDPVAMNGAANATEGKLDFKIMKDKQGKTMMRWLPEMFYIDMSMSPAGQMGLFQQGSFNNGMIVMPIMSAENYLTSSVFSYYHPNASNIRVKNTKKLPDLAKMVKNETKLIMDLGFTYDAAMVEVEYTEDGINYEEQLVAAIVNMGAAAGGMWKNRYTFYTRAPKGQLKSVKPAFAHIGNSIRLNPQWVQKELKAVAANNDALLKTQREIIRIGNEITRHRQRTNEIIMQDAYNILTGQEDYVNPYSGEVEQGTNEYEYRWVSDGDHVIYTDDPNYDPNAEQELNHFEFKRSHAEIKK